MTKPSSAVLGLLAYCLATLGIGSGPGIVYGALVYLACRAGELAGIVLGE